jgi:hypothetical protein
MRHYLVIRSYDIDEFHFKVEKAMNDGWTLQGGVSVTVRNDNFNDLLFAQALSQCKPSQYVALGDPH